MNKPVISEFNWLIKQGKPFIWLHVGNLACVIIASLLTMLDPLIMKWLIDTAIPSRNIWLLPIIAGAFLTTYIGRLIFNRLGSLLTFLAVQKMVFRIRLRMLRHLQKLTSSYHDNTPVGETLHRLEQDVEQVGGLGGDFLPYLLRMTVTTSMIIGAMLIMNWRLTCIIAPLLPVFMLLRHHYRSRLKRFSDVVQERQSRVSSFLHEHFSAITQIQLLTCELAEARHFTRLAGEGIRVQGDLRKANQAFSMLSLSIIALGIAIILGYGGYQVMSGTLTTGGLVAFYSYLVRLFEPINNAVNITSRLQRVGASIRRIRSTMEAVAPLKEHTEARELGIDGPITVELRDVSFSYQTSRDVLVNVSLQIDPGERVALVGSSGSGKTTIGKLLTRLYDAQDGTMLLNGVDVRDIRLSSLRTAVALVPQDAVLLDGTLRENLLRGNSGAIQPELDLAVETAQLDDLIRRLPQGLETQIGPRGGKLSGGERQRVALARAFLRDPKLLILDEPTAALDAATERAFLYALTQFTHKRTTIVISHRLSTILWADRIVVIDRGRIAEEGTHRELYCRNGIYRRLCDEQFLMEDETSISEHLLRSDALSESLR